MTALIELSGVSIATATGRPLFEQLDARLERGKIALVGRNGVGKSTLLAVLAGSIEPRSGRVRLGSPACFVPQTLERGEASGMSHGEQRRRALVTALASGREILLLDEPTEDLDEGARVWLRDSLRGFDGCLLVASHDRDLLADFEHFLVVSESGCRYFAGTLVALEAELEQERLATEERYVRGLNRLAAAEEHDLLIERRKARKKRYGRCSELDRATPRIRLNQKRSDAQVSHGRLAKLREERLEALRGWSKATRRALTVRLAAAFPVPSLPAPSGSLLTLRGLTAEIAGRTLFRDLNLEWGRQRIAVIGPNGAGKSTLLEIALRRREASAGTARLDHARVGSVAQAAADWQLNDSLLSLLRHEHPVITADELAALVVGHRFPLALAERPLRSLSPGERTRAALICLFRRTPAPELLVLDEPTFSLDLLGQRALVEALRRFSGGLLVSSHDRAFLDAIGIDSFVRLGG